MISKKRILVLIFMMILSTNFQTNSASSKDLENDKIPPLIEHEPQKETAAYTPIKIETKITDDISIPTAKLFYKKDHDDKFASVTMNMSTEDSVRFTAEIPAMDVESSIIYYIESSDGTNLVKSANYTMKVAKPNVDYSKIPMFLVTEIVPDSTNLSGVDGYEFIEIYNNTDKDVNFKDYKILYRLGAEATTDSIWPSSPDHVVIKSRSTLVFWVINEQNKDKTVADFNKHYHTDLVENENIVRIDNGSISNNGLHGIVVADNTKKEISVSYYNDQQGADDTKRNKGILFKYPENGTTTSVKISAGKKKGTPGTVEREQVPKTPVHIKSDPIKPTLANLSIQSEVKDTEDIELIAAADDNEAVKTVKVFYKTNDPNTYNSVILHKDSNSQLFHHIIPSPVIIGKEFIEYYYTVSDGTNETISNTYKVKVTNDRNRDSLRSNVKEKQIITGNTAIKGTSSNETADKITLLIDDKKVTTNTYHTLENTAFLTFEVSNVNLFFQNGVTVGDELLHVFDDLIVDWQTVTVAIEPEHLKIGDNVLKIHSGNKASSFDMNSEENRDDFQLRNVRLVLGDGTIITDSAYNNSTTVIDMNDRNPSESFNFIISEDDAVSKAFNWDTSKVKNGQHTVTVGDSNEEIKMNVLVDNHAPIITPSITKDKQYKGEFIINPVIFDSISGVSSSEVTLDGKKITTPYTTSSSQLTPGNHLLRIEAEDHSGNKSEMEIPFKVVEENPLKPLVKPAIEHEDGNSRLRVEVTDPTDDRMDVMFYQASKYKPNKGNSITSYQNTASVEPPQTLVPEGEQPLVKEEIALISKEDGKYLTTDSKDQFPYHRFSVTIDRPVDEKDTVELVWKGKSLHGRKVTMYAWSELENKWKVVTYQIAGKDAFTLKGTVNVSEFVKNQKINVIIQDEIPASANDYDYTFVWMSDTQYYSKFYPYILQSQTQWITQNKEAMKIKYVFHTGDLVENSNQENQWRNADQFLNELEAANIPYGVLAGNHDVDHKSSDYKQFYKYFGANRFKNKSYYGGSYKNNRGHYDLISVGGIDYIFVYLGWGVDEEGIAWVNQVLKEHQNRKAILNLHEYLMASGTRHPHGDRLYNEIVLKNKNVIAVLSGHYHESQTLVDEIDDDHDGIPDRQVYQLLADYQSGPEGGQGYMRLLHIDQENNRIIVNTYSPYLNDYNYFNSDVYPGKDEFVMNFDMQPMKKRVSTDYFEVNVYTDTEIGRVERVKSGELAEVQLGGLNNNSHDSWYTVVTDHFSGKTVSDIWSFKKMTKLD